MNDYEKGYKQAIEDINTPQKITLLGVWEHTRCPRCNSSFGEYEETDDGYVLRAYTLERCPYCGQKIVWD